MEIQSSIDLVRERVHGWRCTGERVAFVPTMGNLHEGHLHLVNVAQSQGGRLVVSIFINALQFGQNEDLSTYPRTIDEDIRKLSTFPVDLLFLPRTEDIYSRPLDETAKVMVPYLSDILCGQTRPGHFAGVTTVVNVLFNIVRPDTAVFGEKDYQQLLIIRRMAADLHHATQIMSAATIRDPDGLALSSRNSYLSTNERRTAGQLYASLSAARDMIVSGNGEFAAIERLMEERLTAAGFRVDYFTVRRARDLGEPMAGDRELVILAAAWLGKTRLIDNIKVALNNTP